MFRMEPLGSEANVDSGPEPALTVDHLLLRSLRPSVRPVRGEKASETSSSDWIASELPKRIEHWKESQLLPERHIALKSVARAVWKPDVGKAEVFEARGKHFDTMGRHIQSVLCLNIDEALWLVDRGRLELFVAGLPASVHQVYHLFHECGYSLENYMVYSYLKRLGYIVLPTSLQQAGGGAAIKDHPSEKTVHPAWGTHHCPFSGYSEGLQQRLCMFSSRVGVTASSAPGRTESSFKILYDVWTPAHRKGFSKRNPPVPSFRLVVCPEGDPVPPMDTVISLNNQSGAVELKFAVVGSGGLVDFFAFTSTAPAPLNT